MSKRKKNEKKTKKKTWGSGWEEIRLYPYDIRAEGALPPSITVIARVVRVGCGVVQYSRTAVGTTTNQLAKLFRSTLVKSSANGLVGTGFTSRFEFNLKA